MSNTDRARKLLVRSALVTSATVATVIGAQNLATLDARELALTPTPLSDTVLVEVSTPAAVERVAPSIIIQHAAPSIIVLRQSGQQNSAVSVIQSGATTSSIQPPAPVQVTAPEPVIVQQPVVQSSRSSR